VAIDSNKTPLTKLGLPTRIVNSLKSLGINSVENLSSKSADELLSVKGIGNATLFFIDSALRKYQHRGLRGSTKIKRTIRAEQTHIFDQNFPAIFERYKNKKGIQEWEKNGLTTLERYLLKSDYKSELFSGVLVLPDQQAAELARRFRNYRKTQMFKKALDRYASKKLKLQGVILHRYSYSDFWREYRRELKSILDSTLRPIDNRNCFGKFNPYLVYMLLFSSEYRGALRVHVTFFNSLSHFFRCENELTRKMYGDDLLYEMGTEIDDADRKKPEAVVRGEGKTYIKNSLKKALESSSDFIIFTDPHTSSFVQFAVGDKEFLLDFPVAPGNNNYGKLPELEKVLLSLSFKKAAGKEVSDLEVKEFGRYKNGLEVVDAMCGGNLDFIANLTDKIFKKVHKLPNDYTLEIELG